MSFDLPTDSVIDHSIEHSFLGLTYDCTFGLLSFIFIPGITTLSVRILLVAINQLR